MSRTRPPEPAEPSVPTWEDIARSHGRFLYTVAYRLTGNHDDAQDLVQDVLIRVQRGLVTFQPGSLEAWLSRIATNAFLDDVRRKKRRPFDVVADVPEAPLAARPDGEAGADKALDAVRLPDHVQQALDQLPPDFKAVVVACDVVGLEYAEAAETIGVPVGTVRSRLHRGRALLRAILGEHR
ncbi:MAG: sigma-70 family RNA polymerase sigma factor [Acidimicrobiia bacterium]